MQLSSYTSLSSIITILFSTFQGCYYYTPDGFWGVKCFNVDENLSDADFIVLSFYCHPSSPIQFFTFQGCYYYTLDGFGGVKDFNIDRSLACPDSNDTNFILILYLTVIHHHRFNLCISGLLLLYARWLWRSERFQGRQKPSGPRLQRY